MGGCVMVVVRGLGARVGRLGGSVARARAVRGLARLAAPNLAPWPPPARALSEALPPSQPHALHTRPGITPALTVPAPLVPPPLPPQLRFLEPFLRNAELTDAVRLLYKVRAGAGKGGRAHAAAAPNVDVTTHSAAPLPMLPHAMLWPAIRV